MLTLNFSSPVHSLSQLTMGNYGVKVPVRDPLCSKEGR
ncbi:hypothetical protein ISN45_At03g056110 [Arabidopsis thaliana x Arabidopsis arenosa]|uniref:Uncharacterized protein n=2 Tax=Arabidopsis TaxID=3701 RepID=A0A8T2FIY4_ARASU|nr:hypothetical protein ISN45_At03g056110 [Arabidopsis thaliana x Arabidopsis arenosa]KAG7635396.1 hypothetical protein ISN44_As03g054940 [Arabidopsis suecica]